MINVNYVCCSLYSAFLDVLDGLSGRIENRYENNYTRDRSAFA